MWRLFSSILVFILLCFFALSCKDDGKKDIVISGKITNMPVSIILLQEIGLGNKFKILDSTISKEDGTFELRGKYSIEDPRLLRIRLSNHPIDVVGDAPKIDIKADWKKIDKYEVYGSPGSSSLKKLDSIIKTYNYEILYISKGIDSLQRNAPNSTLLVNEKDRIRNRLSWQRKEARSFADTTKSLPVAIYALLNISDLYNDKIYLQQINQSMHSRFGHRQQVKEFDQFAQKIIYKYDRKALKVGDKAPLFSIVDNRDRLTTLQQFKGKYVLLCFWASWSKVARTDNKNLVTLHEKFKDKNIVFLSASLDNSRADWKNAIEEDKLHWNHVCDFKRWDSPLISDYGIDFIPANFLIDPNGYIMSITPNPEELSKTLSTFLP